MKDRIKGGRGKKERRREREGKRTVAQFDSFGPLG